MPGGMVALDTDADTALTILADLDGISVANSNAPHQTVIAGSEDRLEAALERCRERGVRGQRLPVACAFHSPLVAPAREPLAQALAEARLRPPRRPVYSNVTAARYTEDPRRHPRHARRSPDLAGPLPRAGRGDVRGRRSDLRGSRAQGDSDRARGQILRDRPHLAMPSDLPGRPGLVQLLHLVARLATHGVAVKPERLFRGRVVAPIDLDRFSPETGRPKLSPTTWIINSVRNRPKDAPEPRLLGQARPLDERASAASRRAHLAGCARDLRRASLKRTLEEGPCRDHQRQAPAALPPRSTRRAGCRPRHRRLTPPRSCSGTRT